MCDKESNDLFSSRWEIFEIIFALIITLTAIINNLASTEGFFIFLAAYIIAGHKIIRTSIKNVLTKEVFDENILMSLATIGAIAIGEYPEAVMVMVLYRIGEYFQDNAIKKSRKSIKKLIDIRPNYANVEYGNKIIRKEPSEVEPNEIIVVRAGERIPLDGVVTEGKAVIDTSTLTGEAIPRVIAAGEIALSGCININGLIRIKVTKEYNESTINRILELVEQANSKKAKTEKFIKKFARYYTPTVVLGALLLATIMPLATGTAFNIWFERALTFLVISCPCALVISIPLGFFAGIGYASRCGILIKGSNYLELLSRVDSVIFDKTGTLTKGCFKINEIVPQNGFTPEELLKLTVLAETHSNHPIAVCIKKTYPTNTNIVKEVEEEAGQGISAVVDGEKILAGNAELMKKYNIPFKAADDSASVIYIAKNGEFVGYITLSDELKPDTEKAICELKKLVKNIIILTGDQENPTKEVASKIGIDKIYTQLLPTDKVAKLEEIVSNKVTNKSVIFVGEGINDAPVLARADVGIAMGALGSEAAIEAADVVIMDDKLTKIPAAIKIAQNTMAIVKQNIVFTIGIKIIFLILGTFGFITMWGAVFADVGTALLAVLNSLRAAAVKNIFQKKSKLFFKQTFT